MRILFVYLDLAMLIPTQQSVQLSTIYVHDKLRTRSDLRSDVSHLF